MGDGDGVVFGIAVCPGHHGDGPDVKPPGGGEGQRPGDGQRHGRRADRRHHHRFGGSGIQPHGIDARSPFEDGEGGRGKKHPGPGRRSAQTDAAVLSDVPDEAGDVGGSGLELDIQRRGRGHHAERGAGALARRDDGDAPLDVPAPGGNRPVNPDGERRRLQNARPPLAILLPLQINEQRERRARVAAQIQDLQPTETIKQTLGQAFVAIAAQIQLPQRPQAVEQIRVQRGKPVVGQAQRRQCLQLVEDSRRQRGEARIGQPQRVQPGQAIEECRRQGGQAIAPLAALATQVQDGQRRQLAEDVRGQCDQFPVATQIQAGQRVQSAEVAAPEPPEECAGQVEVGDLAQLLRGDRHAVGHTVHRRHNGIAHRRGAGADGRPVHHDGEREAGGVIVEVGDRPGVARHRRQGRRRAGQRARRDIQRQPGGQGRPGERITQEKVAACGRRQGQHRRDVHGVRPGRHRGRDKRRLHVGLHRDHRGHARPQVRARGHAVTHLRDRPGQRDGRAGHRRDAGQRAGVGIQCQAGGNVAGRQQGIGQGTGVTAGGHRQGQGRHRGVHHIGQGHQRLNEKRPLVVNDRQRDAAGRDHGAVAPHLMGDDANVVDAVRIVARGDGHPLRPMPVRRGKGQGSGEAHLAPGRGSRHHRHHVSRGGVQHDGIGGRVALGHGEGGGDQDHPGTGVHRAQPETGVVGVAVTDSAEPGSTEHNHRRRVHGHAEHLAGAPACRDDGGRPLLAHDGPGQRDVPWGGLREVRPPLAVPLMLEINVQRERVDVVAVQGQPRRQGQTIKQSRGQGGELVVEQLQARQPAQPLEDVRGQGGQHVAGEIQRLQPAQLLEVAAPEGVEARAGQVKSGDPAQVGRGQCRTVGHAGHLAHNGRAHRRRAEADRRAMHRKGEREAAGVVVDVGRRPGIDARRRGAHRCAGQRARTGIKRQPVGQRGAQGVGQVAVAQDGGRQRHDRHEGAVQDIGLGRERRHPEPRGGVVAHRDDDVVGRRVAVAGHRMGNGRGGVVGVIIQGRGDGDGPGDGPVRGGEGQRPGDRHRAIGGADRRRHRHHAGGGTVQPDGVDVRVAFPHGQGTGSAKDSGLRLPHGQAESPIVLTHFDEGRHARHEGRLHGRGDAKDVAEALARLDGGSTRPPVKARGLRVCNAPWQRDGQRGGLPDTRLHLAIALLDQLNVQHERATGVGVQVEKPSQVQPVKQSLRQRAELIAGQNQ